MRWDRASTTPSPVTISLQGVKIRSDGFLVYCKSPDSANSEYGAGTCENTESLLDGPADADGTDNHAIVRGNPATGSFEIVDLFGVVGESGFRTDHDFVNGRVVRKRSVTTAKAVWDANDWYVFSSNFGTGR